ncbi:MAG: VTC domain-containing protein [Limisphaerales bacterium]
MQGDRLQLQRFEFKYVVSETAALVARDFVSAYLQLDENGVGKQDLSYPVHSVYLDSDDLKLYHQTINGDKNRYKLRIRFYNDNPESPLFLEIKKRSDNAISKQRCALRREGILDVLEGRIPSSTHILSKDPKHLCALENFVRLTMENRAKPKGHVAYYREAWISPHDNSVRVTIDRSVRFDAEPTARFCTRMNKPVDVFGNQLVLELKFTGRFPMWFNELVRALGVMQRSAAKYADGITVFGEEKLGSVCRPHNRPFDFSGTMKENR